MARDYYDTLGVSRTATPDEIRAAYRKLARKYHPDVNKDAGAPAKFTEVQQAYDVLSDEQKRKLYDQFGTAAFESGGPGAGGPNAGAQQRGPHYSWSNVGGPGGGPGFGVSMDEEDMSSVFDAIFGGRGGSPFGGGGGAGGAARPGRTRARAQQPAEVRQDVTIDFMTAAKGGVQKLRISEEGGKQRTIEVSIPAGSEEGSQLRVRAGAGPGRDLILRLHIAGHELFRRGEGESAGKGLDLTLDLPLTISEATLGATVLVPTLDRPLELQVPPGTASGKKLRLKARGIHDAEGRQGDLYAVIRIVPPRGDSLTADQQQVLREIGAETPGVRAGPGWPRST
jgi:curved DNA-binding protein